MALLLLLDIWTLTSNISCSNLISRLNDIIHGHQMVKFISIFVYHPRILSNVLQPLIHKLNIVFGRNSLLMCFFNFSRGAIFGFPSLESWSLVCCHNAIARSQNLVAPNETL